MCRSIKTLRPPYAEQVTDQDVRAAGARNPLIFLTYCSAAARNAAAFEAAVDEIAATTARLLAAIEVRPAAKSSPVG